MRVKQNLVRCSLFLAIFVAGNWLGYVLCNAWDPYGYVAYMEGKSAAAEGNVEQAMLAWKMAADKGVTGALFRMAELVRQQYDAGMPTHAAADTPERAAEWYRRTLETQNNIEPELRGEAAFRLGMCYLKGWGVPRSEKKAKSFIRQAEMNYGRKGALAELDGNVRAKALYDEAAKLYKSDDYYKLQLACSLLLDQRDIKSANLSVKMRAERLLKKAYQKYLTLVKTQLSYFDDEPNEKDAHMYDNLASYGDARATRLKGQLLMKRREPSCKDFLEQAAKLEDATASSLIAKCFADGTHGYMKDSEAAQEWVERSIKLGGDGAYYIRAMILWDGNIGSKTSLDLNMAVDDFRKVYLERKNWEMSNKNKGRKRITMRLIFRRHLDEMQYWSENRSKLYQEGKFKDLFPRFEPLLFSSMEDNEALKSIVEHVSDEYENYSHYQTPPGCKLDADMIKFVSDYNSDTNYYGKSFVKYTDNTLQFKVLMCYKTIQASANISEEKFWLRQMLISENIAYLLADALFSQRYPCIVKDSENSQELKNIYIGYLKKMSYEYIKWNYFRGKLSEENFSNIFCSVGYKDSFDWFNKNFLSIDWDKLDDYERKVSGGKSVHNRTLVKWEDD